MDMNINEHAIDSDMSKPELIKSLIDILEAADNMTIKQLCNGADYKHNPELRFPQTKSEHIVSDALSLLLEHDFVDDDPLLDEITSIFSQLDTDVNKPQEWQELKRLMIELKNDAS